MQDRFLLAAGFESWPTRSEEYHVYDRAAGSWAAAKVGAKKRHFFYFICEMYSYANVFRRSPLSTALSKTCPGIPAGQAAPGTRTGG